VQIEIELFLARRDMEMKKKSKMPAAMILCGGQGTRIRDVTELLPKPMVPIGSHPIVWHIMKSYASFGVKRFILCLGYKREAFIDYFLNYHARATDITLHLGEESNVVYHGGHGEEDWEVTLVDTGDKTMTGGRIARASKYLGDDDSEFFITYGDAVADIDISALLAKHRELKKSLTVTAVHPVGRFGDLVMDANGYVAAFREKPEAEEGVINGGFMVAQRSLVGRYLSTSSQLVFEQEPMNRIVGDGEMSAYEHYGFWQCMDTFAEYTFLNDWWNEGKASWKVW